MDSKKLLIVGGTGFIGSHLTREGLDSGFSVTTLSLSGSDFKLDGDFSSVKKLKADIRNFEELESVLKGLSFDYVINTGGYIDHTLIGNGGDSLISQHLQSVVNLSKLFLGTKVKKFIQLGSSDEYGNQSAPQNEKYRESPISPYSFAKTAATHYLQMLYRSEGFPVTIFRIFLTYGPGQDQKRFLPQIIKGCLDNQTFPVSEGMQIRDFCYVEDIVRAIIKSLDTENTIGEIINLASGNPITIRAMLEKVQKIAGSGYPEFGKFPYRPGENMELYANIDNAKRILGWDGGRSLEAGLKETIQWYADRD